MYFGIYTIWSINYSNNQIYRFFVGVGENILRSVHLIKSILSDGINDIDAPKLYNEITHKIINNLKNIIVGKKSSGILENLFLIESFEFDDVDFENLKIHSV